MLIITNETNFADGEVSCEDWEVVANLDLTRLVDDQSRDWNPTSDASILEGRGGQHCQGAEDNLTAIERVPSDELKPVRLNDID